MNVMNISQNYLEKDVDIYFFKIYCSRNYLEKNVDINILKYTAVESRSTSLIRFMEKLVLRFTCITNQFFSLKPI